MEMAEQIRTLADMRVKKYDIANVFGISRNLVSGIIKNRNWRADVKPCLTNEKSVEVLAEFASAARWR